MEWGGGTGMHDNERTACEVMIRMQEHCSEEV